MAQYHIKHFTLRYPITMDELYEENGEVCIQDAIRNSAMKELERKISGSSDVMNDYFVVNKHDLVYNTFGGHIKVMLSNVDISVDERYLNRLKLLNPEYVHTKSPFNNMVYRFSSMNDYMTFITLTIEETKRG